MRRVVFLLATLQIGGMETHCVELAAEFTRRGLSVAAIIPESAGLEPLEERFLAAGAQVRRASMDAREGRLAQFRDWPRLVRQLRAWQPDVVHVHSGGPSGGLALVAAARLARPAMVVLTEHNPPSESLAIRQRIFRVVMDRMTDALIAVSRSNAALRLRLLGAPRERFAVVLNGVELRSSSSESKCQARLAVRTQLAIPPASAVIGCVVRLVEGKGLHDLVRAFAIVSRTTSAELLLVGDGPMREELEVLGTTLGIGSRMHLVGHKDDPYPFLDAMDAFVLAVPVGSMSIALLEAMARGVACVITFGGPEEAVIPDETGLTAPPNDPEGLARALLRLVEDAPLRARLGAAAAEHVMRHFSVARVADDVLEIYDSARIGRVPSHLRFDAPPNPYPGNRP